MGCDIHCYKEKFVGDQWVTADEWQAYDYGDDDKGQSVPWEKRFTDRNYNLFGLLSNGVRSKHEFSFAPRGIPFNSSPEVFAACGSDGEGGHGHSYLYLHELRDMQKYLKTATVSISGLKNAAGLEALQASIASDAATDWSLLYPYCQGTSDHTYREFSIDVPAEFIVGGDLETIIGMFDGAEGENHRIVFWFDN